MNDSKDLKTGFRTFDRTIRDDGTTLQPSDQNPLGTYHYNPASITERETRYALKMVSRYVDIHSNSTAETTLTDDQREEAKQAIVCAWMDQEWIVGFHVKSPLKQTLLATLRWARRCRWIYLTYEQEREGRNEHGSDTVERLADLSPFSGQSESAIALDPKRIFWQVYTTNEKGYIPFQTDATKADRSRLSKRKGCRTWKRIGTTSNREAAKTKKREYLYDRELPWSDFDPWIATCHNPETLRKAIEG